MPHAFAGNNNDSVTTRARRLDRRYSRRQIENLHVNAGRVMDERRRADRARQSRGSDQIILNFQQMRALQRIRNVVHLARIDASAALDVQQVALRQEMLERAGRRCAQEIAERVARKEARSLARLSAELVFELVTRTNQTHFRKEVRQTPTNARAGDREARSRIQRKKVNARVFSADMDVSADVRLEKL